MARAAAWQEQFLFLEIDERKVDEGDDRRKRRRRTLCGSAAGCL
jgi:hypothetical protein